MFGRKGQGAIEYLLILAAVLIVVAGAVYFITRTAGPPLGFTATLLDNDDVKIEVTTGGPIKAGDWVYRLAGQKDWLPGVDVDLEPGATFILKIPGASRGSELQIKHETSGTVYKQKIL